MWRCLQLDASDKYWQSTDFSNAAVATVLQLARNQLTALQTAAPASLPAALMPLQRALRLLSHHGTISTTVQQGCAELLEAMDSAANSAIATRRSLVNATLVHRPSQRLFNPSFEMDFEKHRDFDPDRERAKYKRYKRMAAKEQRGAVLGLGSACFNHCATCFAMLLVHVAGSCWWFMLVHVAGSCTTARSAVFWCHDASAPCVFVGLQLCTVALIFALCMQRSPVR